MASAVAKALADNVASAFPASVLKEISYLEGNQKCADCPSLDTDWGSVNHGTLICLECAGRHRSLGVHVSFVRSIHMDTWTKQQVRYYLPQLLSSSSN